MTRLGYTRQELEAEDYEVLHIFRAFLVGEQDALNAKLNQ